MSLTEQDVAFIHEVADKIETEVIAKASPGRWRAGSNVDIATRSSMRSETEDGKEWHLGTAIDMVNQRAIMGGQPEVLRTNVAVLRSTTIGTEASLADSVHVLAQMYNKTMSLSVSEPAGAR